MLIKREYTHRTFGTIGSVAFEAPEGEYKLDGNVLSANSVEHLLTFALQTLQDSYAGAQNAYEAVANFAKKYEKLIDGTIGTRAGTGVSDEVRIARGIMKENIRITSKETWKKFKELSEEDQIATLDKNIAKNAEFIAERVAEKMKELAAEKAKRAALSKSISFEL